MWGGKQTSAWTTQQQAEEDRGLKYTTSALDVIMSGWETGGNTAGSNQ